jgi:hypothetical protein
MGHLSPSCETEIDDRKQSRVPPRGGAGRRREVPMSFRVLSMVDVREVLRGWQAGQRARGIARVLAVT